MTRVRYEKVELDDVIDLSRGGEKRFITLPSNVADVVDVEVHSGTWRFLNKEGGMVVEYDDLHQARQLVDALEAVSAPEIRRRVSKQFHLSARLEEKTQARLQTDISDLEAIKVLLRDAVQDWRRDGFVLQKPAGSGAHRYVDAYNDGRVRCLTDDQRTALGAMGRLSPVPFVIEHDWAAAFGNATELHEGEYPLPFDEVLFEFRVNSRTVALYAGSGGCAVMIELGESWLIAAASDTPVSSHTITITSFDENLPLAGMFGLLLKQVRAVCIALDADVVLSETVRAPHKLNQKRIGKGRAPLADYHVVRLRRRERAQALPDAHEPTKHRSPRLHFVRGHWRHYETHKTWIKWHLRGDPDLGFIDKHYRL